MRKLPKLGIRSGGLVTDSVGCSNPQPFPKNFFPLPIIQHTHTWENKIKNNSRNCNTACAFLYLLLEIKSCYMYKKQDKQFYIAKIFPCQLYIFLHSLLHRVHRECIKIEHLFSSIMRNVDSLIYKTRINRNSQILKKHNESSNSYTFIYKRSCFFFNSELIFLRQKTKNYY